MSTGAVYETMGFLPHPRSESGTNETFGEGTIVTFARLHNYFTTVVNCFSDNETDKAGGHRQRPYHDTFASFFQFLTA